MTTPYQRILCPIDFSDVSKRALSWASALARGLGSELTVLHAVDTGLLNVGNLVAVPDARDELCQRANAAMTEWSTELDLRDAALRVEEGAPADVIVEAASSESFDLLVIGTHGHSGIEKLLLGSVTEKVLHRVAIPLLAFSPRAPEGELRPRRIVLAVDFGPETAAVVRHGVWLAEHFDAAIIAVHAVPVPYLVLNDRTMERLTPEQMERLKDTLTAERREELAAAIPDTTAELTCEVTLGSAYRTLSELVHARAADLVVMGRGGHGKRDVRWVGSTCHKLVRSLPCPVLIAPP